jgi:hypothetical protein
LPGIRRFRDDGRVLVEHGTVVWVDAGELAGGVFVVGGDDGVLGDVFKLAGLGEGVRDVGVLGIIVEPVGGAWWSTVSGYILIGQGINSPYWTRFVSIGA